MNRDEATTLGAVVTSSGGSLQTGPFGSQLHAKDYTAEGTPLVMPVNIGDNQITVSGISRIGAEDAHRLRKHALREGDIVFGRRGEVGRRSLVRREHAGWICGSGCLAARFGPDREHINPAYIAHYVGSRQAQRWLEHNAVGGTMANLNTAILAALPLLLPSRHQQDRVVVALDDVQSLVFALERLIVKTQAIKQGMMQQLLTGKTRLPGFTAPWRDTLLGDHVSYVKTIALSRGQLDSESSVRYLHYGDIHTRANVSLDAAHEPLPRASSSLLRNAGRLQMGDLVFADASEDAEGVGKSVEITAVPEAGVVPGLHTIAARFDNTILADGFKAYLQFVPSFRQTLLRLAAGTKVLATTRSFISSITLALPSIDEQRAIAAVLDDADAEIQRLHARLAKTRDIKQGMMQELLTGRTRLLVAEGAA